MADEIESKLANLLSSFRTGNAIRNGIPVAIIGAPNVGKSTLLNALVGEQRAIVSDIQGTTRDTIEDTVILDGILFRIIDTAGLRETNDTIEQMGVERSLQAAQKAQIILYVKAPQPPEGGGEESLAKSIAAIKGTVIRVLNKCDTGVQGDGIRISAKNGEIEPLKREMVRVAKEGMQSSAVMLSNARHYEAITRAHDAIVRVKEGMSAGLSGELLSMDLQDCLAAIGEVTGQITNAEVLSNIFSKFCIGK